MSEVQDLFFNLDSLTSDLVNTRDLFHVIIQSDPETVTHSQIINALCAVFPTFNTAVEDTVILVGKGIGMTRKRA